MHHPSNYAVAQHCLELPVDLLLLGEDSLPAAAQMDWTLRSAVPAASPQISLAVAAANSVPARSRQ